MKYPTSKRSIPLAVAIILAAVLLSPSINNGLYIDDYSHRRVCRTSVSEFQDNLFNLFDWTPKYKPEFLKELGVLPWWVERQHEARFFRPLASLFIIFDYSLWPDSTSLMHVHSILWFLLTIIAVNSLFRKLLSPKVAGCATLIFAIDDVHGFTIGWLANRYTILVTLFCVLSLRFYVAFLQGQQATKMLALSLFCYGLSLLAGESGVTTYCYVLSFTLFLSIGDRRNKLVAIVLFSTLTAVWKVAHSKMGYFVSTSGMYVDPVSAPFDYIQYSAWRFPAYFIGQFAYPGAGLFQSGSDFIILAWAITIALSVVFGWTTRGRRPAQALWIGSVLSMAILCTAIPHNRRLMLVSVGAAGLVAEVFSLSWHKRSSNRLYGLAACLFGFVHLVMAPIVLSLYCQLPGALDRFARSTTGSINNKIFTKEDKVIVVNTPAHFWLVGYRPLINEVLEPRPIDPKTVYTLVSGEIEVSFKRIAEHSFVIRAIPHFLTNLHDSAFMPVIDFSKKNSIDLDYMTVTVNSFDELKRPTEVAVSVKEPVGNYKWLTWNERNNQFDEITPPQIGQELTMRTKIDWLGIFE